MSHDHFPFGKFENLKTSLATDVKRNENKYSFRKKTIFIFYYGSSYDSYMLIKCLGYGSFYICYSR
jgi:hypothetical protein